MQIKREDIIYKRLLPQAWFLRYITVSHSHREEEEEEEIQQAGIVQQDSLI